MKTFINVSYRLKRLSFIEEFKIGKPLIDELQKYFPNQELEKYQGLLLIVHGDKDEKINIKRVKKCFEQLANHKKEFIVIKGSRHGFHTEPHETKVINIMIDFFQENEY